MSNTNIRASRAPWLLAAALLLGFSASAAWAQKLPPAAQAQPATAAQDQPAAKPGVDSKNPTTQPAGKGCGNVNTRGWTPTVKTEGPQPKFVCQQPTIELGPVWRGESLVYHFEIANEGEGPLEVLLKGG